jgi:hypothetical protein
VLEDGISYEQLFTGYASVPGSAPTPDQAVERHPYRASGTLIHSVRRYEVGAGYTPLPLPPVEHYYRTPVARVPNSGGALSQVTRRWNIHPGMKPITWVLSESLTRLQQDPRYRGYDLAGAVRWGVESWNEAFGFPVLTTRMEQPGESLGHDELNYYLVDPDRSYGIGSASIRPNPNNGEIRGAIGYIDVGMIDCARCTPPGWTRPP